MKYLIPAVAVIAALVAACGKSDEMSPAALDTERGTARENAAFNVRAWRAQTAAFQNLDILPQGDSTQSARCPSGDGWATIKLVDKRTGVAVRELKCSTYSANIGCREDRPREEGSCQKDLPSPLPRIAQ